MSFILVFLAMTGLDFVYAEWAKACAEKRALWASGMAAGVILLSVFVTRHYVEDAWYAVPACAGAFAGTWLSIRYGK